MGTDEDDMLDGLLSDTLSGVSWHASKLAPMFCPECGSRTLPDDPVSDRVTCSGEDCGLEYKYE